MMREVPDHMGSKEDAERLAARIRSHYARSSRGVKVWTESMTLDKQVLWIVKSNIEFSLPPPS